MKYNCNEVEPCRFKVNVSFPMQFVKQEEKNILESFSKRSKRNFLNAEKKHSKKSYNKEVKNKLVQKLCEEAFYEVVSLENIRPFGNPTFTSQLFLEDKFNCEYLLSVYPEFDLFAYKEIEIPFPHLPQTDVELSSKILEELRYKFGEETPISSTDFLKKDDKALINYTAYIDGEKFESLSSTQAEELIVGKSNISYMDFDNNLLGMRLKEKRTFNTVANSNALPLIRGKQISFEVELIGAIRVSPCALDDSLAKKMNKESFEDLKIYVNKIAHIKFENEKLNLLKSSLSNKILELHNINIPNWMLLSEVSEMCKSLNVNMDELDDDSLKAAEFNAKKSITLHLVLDKLRSEDSDFELSDMEVLEIIKTNFYKKFEDKMTFDEFILDLNKSNQFDLLFIKIKDEYTFNSLVKLIKFVN